MNTFVRVQRFHEALGLAIHDRELEDGGEELQFFYDADVAVDTIIGLTSWDRRATPEVEELAFVVRALLSTGCLPTVRFLRPHLLEFERVLKRLPDTPMLDGFHKAAMNHLIRQWQLSESDEDLQKKLHADEGNGFYEFLREHGYGVFVKLELCLGGTWKPRLRRLLRAGQFHFTGDPQTDLPQPQDPVAGALAAQMSRLRHSARSSHNNQVDAHALSELARKLGRGIHARFYTETEPVRHLFERLDPSLRGELSEAGLPVERSEEYFLIRSSFPALKFAARDAQKNAPAPPAAAGLFSLPELKELHGRLDGILRKVTLEPRAGGNETSGGAGGKAPEIIDIDAALNAALEEVPAGETHLGELVDRFYNLGFLDSVFLSWSPEEMKQWLPGLYDVKSQGTVVAETRRKLGMSLDGLWETLDREIGQLRTWRDDFVKILSAAERRAHASDGRRLRLDVDLGLGRWGIEEMLDPEVQKRLEEGIAGLLDEATRESNASNLAISLAYRAPDLHEFTHQVMLLWFLGVDELIIRTFRQAAETVRAQVPPWLELLRLVAEIKTAGDHSRRGVPLQEHLEMVVRATRQTLEAAAPAGWDRGFAEMGLAHVCYWGWCAMGLDTRGAGRPWAEESFQAAERAQVLLQPGSLGWAFAVNHCAYIGLRAGIFPQATEDALQTLDQRIPRPWKHYRFADTEVRASTERIYREIRHHGIAGLLSDPALADLRRGMCEQLLRARARLEEYPHWGDSEVVDHLNSINRHLVDLRCLAYAPAAARQAAGTPGL